MQEDQVADSDDPEKLYLIRVRLILLEVHQGQRVLKEGFLKARIQNI